jgi:hypothetical protein
VPSLHEDAAVAVRGVHHASARLRDQRGRRLRLTVDLTEHADVAEVRAALEDELVPDLRRVAGAELPVDVELRPGRARSGTRIVQ